MTQRYLCVRFDSWKRKLYLETISILYESNLKINYFFSYVSQNFELEKPNSLIPSVVRLYNNNDSNNNNNHSHYLIITLCLVLYIISCNLNKFASNLREII